MINIIIPRCNVPLNARRASQLERNKVYVNTSDDTLFLVRNLQDDTFILLDENHLFTFPEIEWLVEWLGENGYSDSWELTELALNIEIK